MILWTFIILTLIIVFTFPSWVTLFYPQPNKELVFQYAKAYDVDPYLVFALIRTESQFKSDATSSRGAVGLMQIMPETARWSARQLGIKNYEDSQLSDPRINIQIGCWYLSNLSREFQGQQPLVIAAYNAGRGNVREWLVQGIWDGSLDKIQNIPFPETRSHVKRVLNDYDIYCTIYDDRGKETK
ncbi:MAG: lytic transglycosylase domain-containing protein [Candidatus Saccharibacteria bacterium]